MDGNQFDQLTRMFGRGGSRRGFLKGLLGFGGAAATSVVVRESDTQAARRPAPSPTPVRCPGTQTWNGSACVCPGGSANCGPDCCPNGQAECCDNACCYGTCYDEELCCPSPRVYCEAGGCCPDGEDCCANEGCCQGVCYANAQGQAVCCRAGSGEVCGADCCPTSTHQCCASADGSLRCVPNGEACCAVDADCNQTCSSCQGDCQVCGPAGVCVPDLCCQTVCVPGCSVCNPLTGGCDAIADCCVADTDCGISAKCCAGACVDDCCDDTDCIECQTCVDGSCVPPFAHPCGDLCCDGDVNGVCCIQSGSDSGGACGFGQHCCVDATGQAFWAAECCDDSDCRSPQPFCLNGVCVDCLVAEHCPLYPDSLGRVCCDNVCYVEQSGCCDCCGDSDCQVGETCVAHVCTPIVGG